MSLGIGGRLYRWIRDFLSTRSLRVVVNGQASSAASINAGVSQGSILGLILFLIFINDLTERVENEIDMFADDTTLSAVIQGTKQRVPISNSIQYDLDCVSDWADDWLVAYNAKKTQLMTISRKVDTADFPTIKFQGETLAEESHIKLLGVHITKTLDWTFHVDKIAKNAGQRLGILRKAKTVLPSSVLSTLYKTKMRSVMEYCGPIWQGASKTVLEKLNSVQNKACKFIGSFSKTIPELNINSLEQRRQVSGLCQIYRMFQKIAPEPVGDLLPDILVPARLSHCVAQRHHMQLSMKRSRTQHHMSSFLPSVYIVECFA